MTKCIVCDKEIKKEFMSSNYKGCTILEFGVCNDCKDKIPSAWKYNEYLFDDVRLPIIENIKKEMEEIGLSKEKIDFAMKEITTLDGWITTENRLTHNMTPEQIAQYKKEKEIQFLLTLNSHKVSTTFSIEGYSIKEYHGIVSGECVIGTGFISAITSDFEDFGGKEIPSYARKLSSATHEAEKRAKITSVQRGGNAIVGASLNYVNFTNDKIGVIFTGTSVTIESIEKAEDVEK